MVSNERSENRIKEIIPFTAATERTKYLGIKPTQGDKRLYAETIRH